MEPVRREARDHPIVANETIFAEKHGILAPAQRQSRKLASVDTIEKLGGVRASDLDLAESRSVEQAKIGAHRAAFPCHRLIHRLIELGEIPGAFPCANVFEDGVAVVDRRVANGL